MSQSRPAAWVKLSGIITDEKSTKSSRYQAASKLVKEHDRQRGVNLANSNTTTFTTYLNESRVKKQIDRKERHNQLQDGVDSHHTKLSERNGTRDRHKATLSPMADAEGGAKAETNSKVKESHDQFSMLLDEYKHGGILDDRKVGWRQNGKKGTNEADIVNESQQQSNESIRRAQKRRIRLLGEINMKGSLSSNPKWQPGVGFEWHLSWESHLVSLRAQTDPNGRLLMPNTLVCGVGPRNQYCMWIESTRRSRRGGGLMLRRAVFLKENLENYVPEIYRKLCAQMNRLTRGLREQLPVSVKKYASATTGSTVTSGIYSFEDLKNALNQLVRHQGSPMALQSFVRSKGKGPWVVRIIYKRGGTPVGYVINGTGRFPQRESAGDDTSLIGANHDNSSPRTEHDDFHRDKRSVQFSHRVDRVRYTQTVDAEVLTNATKDHCTVVVAKEVRAFKIPKAMVKQIVEDLESARGIIVNKIGVDFVQGLDDKWYMLQVKGFELQDKKRPSKPKKDVKKVQQTRSVTLSTNQRHVKQTNVNDEVYSDFSVLDNKFHDFQEDEEGSEDEYISTQFQERVDRLFKKSEASKEVIGNCQGDFCNDSNTAGIRDIPFRVILTERLVNDGNRDISPSEQKRLHTNVPVCIKCHVEYNKLGHDIGTEPKGISSPTLMVSQGTSPNAAAAAARQREVEEYAEKKKLRELRQLQAAIDERNRATAKQAARKSGNVEQSSRLSTGNKRESAKLAPILFPQCDGRPLTLDSLREDEDMDLFTGRVVCVARPAQPEAVTANATATEQMGISASPTSTGLAYRSSFSSQSNYEPREEDEMAGMLSD